MASLADGGLYALSAYTQLTRLVASVAASLWTSLRADSILNIHERTPNTTHLVLFAYQAWGHARPLCNLASRLAQYRHVLITFFTTPAFYDRVKAELLRNLETEDARLDCASRIRLVALQHKGRHTLDNSVLNASFAEAFGNLVKGAPLQCAHTDTQYEAGPVPKTVILDFFALLPLRAVRRLSSPERPVKVFVWFAGAASVIFRLAGPERLGGVGDLPAKSADKAVREQVDVAQAAGDIVLGSEGIVVHIPGLPPIFDYEVEPQIIPARALTGAMCLAAHETITCCDGIILASPECYEPDTTSALRQWMAEKSRPVYCVGPMIPRGAFVNAVEKRQSDCAVEVDDFLTSTLERQGAGSLLYISFGTVHWSAEPEKVWAFLNIVIENQIPFIMSHASLKTSIPPDIVDKVRGSGRGLLIPYSPQQHILSHPATGWFLTHGGHNSVMEAVCAGVPMIFWPFTFDQPLNAIHLTSLGVAYELFNGRTGPGLRPIHRLGKAPVGTLNAVREEAQEVLRAAFGEDGQSKRARLQALRQAVRDARSVRGSSSREIKALVDSF